MRKAVPLLTLAVITPCLTELFVTNVLPHRFLDPGMLLVLFMIYSIPVVLIREVSIAWKLNFRSVFLLGIVYGIFNEGVAAKTLLCETGCPSEYFDAPLIFGFNLPWAAFICSWHALLAIIFPIALFNWFFPSLRNQVLLPRWSKFILAAASLAFGILLFYQNPNYPPSNPHLVLFLLIIISSLAALWLKRGSADHFLSEPGRKSIRPFFLGLVFYPIYIIGSTMLAGVQIPKILISCCILLLPIFFSWVLVKKEGPSVLSISAAALGSYLSGSLLSLIFNSAKGQFDAVQTNLVLSLVFLFWLVVLWKRSFPTSEFRSD